MFNQWDRRFDEECGAHIVDCRCTANVDSGVHDLLHGEHRSNEINGHAYAIWTDSGHESPLIKTP
jgi:hypothetical protein